MKGNNEMTRLEHIAWCKERAIQEFDYYTKTDPKNAVRNGITSMMSDLRKHNETNGQVLGMLCLMEMTKSHSHASFMKFIEGFN